MYSVAAYPSGESFSETDAPPMAASCPWRQANLSRVRSMAVAASAEDNRTVGGSPTSHHMQGRAADLIVPGMTPLAVCQTAHQLRLPCAQIIHEFGRWAHLAVALSDERTQLLTAKLVQGKTRYEPGLA